MNYFINISNHPTTNWSEEQLNEIHALIEKAKLLDLPFPSMSPTESPHEIWNYALWFVDEFIKTYYADNMGKNCVFHVMGEAGTAFALVSMIRQKLPNALVVHSTTHRQTLEKVLPSGGTEKVSVFKFVKFRSYF